MRNKQQPHTIEAEYYENGNQKRYYEKVEQKFPQVFQLVVGLSVVAVALSTLTIPYYLSQRACKYETLSRKAY